MKVNFQYEFTESIIPKRCRKPRRVRQSASMRVTIQEVTAAEAPIAIREHFRDFVNDNLVPVITEYRWFKNKLYTVYKNRAHVGAPYLGETADMFEKSRVFARYNYGANQSEVRTAIRKRASEILFIDGERWVLTGEPRYVVMTFGLGHNHGIGWGTSLSTDNFYNSNIGKSRYFRADQFEQAVASATEVATRRGDTKALPIIEQQNPTRFEILIPDAIRLKPNKEHGNGHPFINRTEQIIESCGNPLLSGLLLIGEAMRG